MAASFPYLVFVSSAIYFGGEFVRANAGSVTLLFLLGSTGMGLAIFARTRWHWFTRVFLWSAGSCLACWMLLLYLPDYPLGGMVIRAVWIMLVASLCVPFSFHRQTRFAQQI